MKARPLGGTWAPSEGMPGLQKQEDVETDSRCSPDQALCVHGFTFSERTWRPSTQQALHVFGMDNGVGL